MVIRILSLLCIGSLALFLLVGNGCKRKSSVAPTAAVIREVSAAGHRYGVAEFLLNQSTLKLFWKAPDGARIGNFQKLNAVISASGERLIFATNAGIFDSSFSPCGLHVENGDEIVPLNLRTGEGNFYLKPNGVFLIDSRGAAIIESSQYPLLQDHPILATQSGPLLLIDGRVNPRFTTDSKNRRIRSRVGVISQDHIVFVLSREPVTFYEFASFFQKALNCVDALYLDGEISRFYPDTVGISDRRADFAGMFAVMERQQ
jgi:uncharacterized protein YigE (DUF2233 family)